MISKQVANIIIAVVISGTALYGLGAFDKDDLTYATVHFDGGFVRIGDIAEQRAFSEFKVQNEGETFFSGTAEEVVSEMNEKLEKEKGDRNATAFNNGVTIKGRVGVKWIGSESSFELTTKLLDLKSTEESPIKFAYVIDEIEKINREVVSNHQLYADKALSFSESPKNSFLLSKIIDAIRK